MPRPALTDEQRSETRRKIRKAAAELYAENGLKDISARTIAEKAGVSVGTLYAYFDNLTDLMQSLWKGPLAKQLIEMEKVLEALENPLKKLRALLEMYSSFANERSVVYRNAFLFVRPDSLEKPAQVSLDDDRIFQMFNRAVVEGQQQGLIRIGAPKEIAQILWSGLHGAIALPMNIDYLELAPPEEALPPMIEALIQWVTLK